MEHPAKHPELLDWLYGQATGEIRLVSPRLELWSAAFSAWLESLSAYGGRKSLQKARWAWKSFFEFRRCPPWEIDRAQIEAWLVRLAKACYTADTIRCYRGRISGFYRFCSQYPPLLSGDPLFAVRETGASGKPFNPVRGVLQPKSSNYSAAYILLPAEARALLRAIDRHTSLVGKRDYAILLTLLLTGLPETQLRLLRWEHLQVSPDGARLAGPLSGDLKELPSAAWDAIHAYLKTSGRLDSIQPGDYLFPPLADPLLRPPSGQASDWLSGRPLSIEQMLASLKAYAAWAGLDASKVTYACLRHTAASLHLAAGADAAGLQRFLGRRYLKDTRRYITHLGRMLARRRPRASWSARLRSRAKYGPLRRKTKGAQPGNQSAMTHGFYTQEPPAIDPQDLPAALARTFDGEIAATRAMLRRAIAFDPKDLREAVRTLDLFGRATMRLKNLILLERQLQAGSQEAEFERALEQAVREMRFGEEEG